MHSCKMVTLGLTRQDPLPQPPSWATVVHLPLIQTQPVAFAPVANADWVLFTSQNAVLAYAPYVQGLPVAVVGPKTAQCAQQLGLNVQFVPTQFDAATLARELPLPPGTCVVWPCGNQANPEFSPALMSKGLTVLPVVTYQTQARTHPLTHEERRQAEQVDVWLMASPSGVTAFDGLQVPHRNFFASIGPSTTQALKRYFPNSQVVTAKPQTMEGLLKAVQPPQEPHE